MDVSRLLSQLEMCSGMLHIPFPLWMFLAPSLSSHNNESQVFVAKLSPNPSLAGQSLILN